jgi:hypothetical protein
MGPALSVSHLSEGSNSANHSWNCACPQPRNPGPREWGWVANGPDGDDMNRFWPREDPDSYYARRAISSLMKAPT